MNIRYNTPKLTALAVSLLSSAFLLSLFILSPGAAQAQTNSPPDATATRPAKTPADQTSVPNASPPATSTQTTGEASQDPTIKKMNEDEKQKVDTKGK
jgi:cytoskeletal protein RodZ